MSVRCVKGLLLALLIVVGAGAAIACGGDGDEEEQAVATAAPAGPYAGASSCQSCHAEQYNEWKVSGHPYILVPAEDARIFALPLPEGVSWDDVSYVVGGYKWKARYLDNDGFFITSPGGEPGNNQYNLATGEWSDYHAGEEKAYDCGKCHTVGYSEEGHQDGLPGLIGTWVASGVECEACHGPAADHVANPAAVDVPIDTSLAACGGCHFRGETDTIPAKGGFIRHHEQYNEHLASPHAPLDCTVCHETHKAAAFSIKAECADCHAAQGDEFAASRHEARGVECIDCHMPKATKSAVAVSDNEGDVMTHLFTINTDPAAEMFTPDGDFANPFLTLNFTCLSCHPDRDIDWAGTYAEGVHSLGP